MAERSKALRSKREVPGSRRAVGIFRLPDFANDQSATNIRKRARILSRVHTRLWPWVQNKLGETHIGKPVPMMCTLEGVGGASLAGKHISTALEVFRPALCSRQQLWQQKAKKKEKKSIKNILTFSDFNFLYLVYKIA